MHRFTLSSALVLAAASAHAQTPLYSVATNSTAYEQGCSVQNSPTPVSVVNCLNRDGCNGPFGYGLCSASAQPHLLWSRIEQTLHTYMNSCGGGWRSGSLARKHIAVIFSGPGNTIQVRPRIAYEAIWTFTASVSNPHGGASLFIPSATNADGNTSMSPGIGLSYDYSSGLFVNNPIGATIEQIGPLTWRATGTYVGRPANVPVGVPVEFFLGLDASMHNGDYSNFPGVTSMAIALEASAHLSGTQAFDLPAGYTVNAPEYNIVNNQWIDPRMASVTSQPSDSAACSGNATFTVIGAGEGPLSYQWRKNTAVLTDGTTIDGSIISGASTATLSINGATESDEGMYDCIISNTFGTATSNAAALTVCAADFNCDTGVDFFDYLDFVDEFSSEFPAADFNRDGDIDFFDYLDFVDAFSIGC